MGDIIGDILWIFICIVLIIVIFSLIIKQVKKGNKFKKTNGDIHVGMYENQVKSIMGVPSMTKNNADGSYEFTYEISEWKGWVRGGNMTRRMVVVFDNNHKVISIGRNENCNRSAL